LEVDRERFRKAFPHLAEEIEQGVQKISIRAVRWDIEVGEQTACVGAYDDPWAGYMPDVIAFIRRCDTEEEALEIIAYLERRGEIDQAYAEKLRKQLKEQGLRSFGPKKEPGYYFRMAQKMREQRAKTRSR